MRVECPHCHQKAIISSTNALSHTVKDLYCQCTNLEGGCGASFVMKLGYSHDLNPPINNTRQMAISLLKNLTLSERQALLQGDLFNN
ncbi:MULTISPECIES: ogr/Delta-like zinc finger family protein [unclassified Methylophaga]|jgi:cell division protein ZapA|uniref:ogr/Delta-like zinc finger family protein n=1 Tax=unclassified Methylophaga TaxID=2629249 RepID=UPI0039C94482|tara:strand:- start:7944 stop:8204 length:261 start_codon:yes stop_codon:yes gene_type:complete